MLKKNLVFICIGTTLCFASTTSAQSNEEKQNAWFDALNGTLQESNAALANFEARGESLFGTIDTRWPSLSKKSKERLMPRLERASVTTDAVFPLLAKASADRNEALSLRALRSLTRRLPNSRPYLLTLMKRLSTHRGKIASALAASAPKTTLNTLIAENLLGAPDVRPALQAIASSAPAEFEAIVLEWLPTAPSTTDVSSLAFALRDVPSAQPTVLRLLVDGFDRAKSFENRWRLAKAAKRVSADESIQTALISIVSGDEPWMLRAAAIESLKGSQQVTRLLLDALSDPTPRVRSTAASSLPLTDATVLALATSARKDAWPIVRSAALSSLAPSTKALPILRAAVSDPSHNVRSQAIALLSRHPDAAAWPLVHAKLKNENEWPDVRRAAILYAWKQCVSRARDTLSALVGQGRKIGASPIEKDLAVPALQALKALRLGADLSTKIQRAGQKGPLGRVASQPQVKADCEPPRIVDADPDVLP